MLNDHHISHLLPAIDPLMKQMPFPDTNYGKQNKQKQTLKPIIIRTLMQTRWTEVGAYQIPEVITKLRTIFHPLVCFVFVYLALLGEVGTRFHPRDDGLTNKREKVKWYHCLF